MNCKTKWFVCYITLKCPLWGRITYHFSFFSLFFASGHSFPSSVSLICSHWVLFPAQFWSQAGKRCCSYLALQIMFASFRQLNRRYPNHGHCLRKWRRSSDEYNLSCNVWTPLRDWRYASIPLLRQEGFFSVLKPETDRFLSGLLKVCLLVWGMVQNQRSLQSWGETWLLAWQYQHLTAEINKVWVFSHRCCVQGKPRTERSLHLWYNISIHEKSVAPSGSQVHVS